MQMRKFVDLPTFLNYLFFSNSADDYLCLFFYFAFIFSRFEANTFVIWLLEPQLMAPESLHDLVGTRQCMNHGVRSVMFYSFGDILWALDNA